MFGLLIAIIYIGFISLGLPVYGLIANGVSASVLSVYLAVFFVFMVVMHEIVVVKTKKE